MIARDEWQTSNFMDPITHDTEHPSFLPWCHQIHVCQAKYEICMFLGSVSESTREITRLSHDKETCNIRGAGKCCSRRLVSYLSSSEKYKTSTNAVTRHSTHSAHFTNSGWGKHSTYCLWEQLRGAKTGVMQDVKNEHRGVSKSTVVGTSKRVCSSK